MRTRSRPRSGRAARPAPHPVPLTIDGVDATALAAEFGTPLYVVDEADARARAAGLKAAFDDAFAASAAA